MWCGPRHVVQHFIIAQQCLSVTVKLIQEEFFLDEIECFYKEITLSDPLILMYGHLQKVELALFDA